MTAIDIIAAEIEAELAPDLAVIEATAAPLAAPPLNLPASFYEERPELAQIRQAAHATARSADAVLGVTLARVAATVPPWIRLPAPVGTPGTLDTFIALIGRSGAGKSSAAKVGALLLPIDDAGVAEVSLGSGEGIIEAYLDFVDEVGDDNKTRKVKRQVRRSVLASLDEGQALLEMGGRKGATLLETLRSAWTGDQLGQHNATEERRRHVAAGQYRLALLTGFQTEHAVALLDDAIGGTPQRFLYFAAEDQEIPDIAPDWPGPLPWRLPASEATTMALDADVTAEIRSRALGRSRGEVVTDPLDAHRDLSRLKVAGLLAVLGRRRHITADDWRLAGDVLDASDRVRSSIIEAAKWAARESERARTDKLIRQTTAVETDATQRALEGMAKAIGRHVHKHALADGCPRACITTSTPGKYRKLATVDDALDVALGRNWITASGAHYIAAEVVA